MIKAVIDIGTNSIKLSMAEVSASSVRMIKDINEITKLGSGMREHGTLTEEAIARSLSCVERYAAKARSCKADSIVIIGTMALRSAKNAADFIRLVKERTGIEIRVLSGEEEADLSFKAALTAVPAAASALAVSFDAGGGSTEFVVGRCGVIIAQKSLNIGAIRLTEDYFLKTPLTAAALKAAQNAITSEIADSGISASGAALIGMGGNITSMASVKLGLDEYRADLVSGTVLTREEVDRQIELYAYSESGSRRKIRGLDPRRAEIITAGACIVRAAMDLCCADCVTVNDSGLRHMLLTE